MWAEDPSLSGRKTGGLLLSAVQGTEQSLDLDPPLSYSLSLDFDFFPTLDLCHFSLEDLLDPAC